MTIRIAPPPPPRRIPSTCPCCDAPLSTRDMERFLNTCEREHVDPMVVAFRNKQDPGVLCLSCFARAITDGAEEGNPNAKRILTKARMIARGMRIVR